MDNSSGSSDSRHLLSVSPPLQISPAARDSRGSGHPIPLSPQWLFPKVGENKLGAGSGEGHNSQAITFGTRQEPLKLSGAGEETDYQKKDVFRPSLPDGESGRRDRWRDEERDTVSSVRRDRWRDGDKEHGEGWVDRWSVNHSSGRNLEGNRAQSERWSDQTHREANYDQRRESKWNTRWGPDNKEGDVARDKGMFPNKDDDLSVEKLHGLLAPGKDEKDGDAYRPWRLTSSHNRGRGDSGFLQNPSSNKQVAAFGHSRGRGDASTFTVGRGRPRAVSSTAKGTPSTQAVVEKGENYPYKYGRAKFLFVYRLTDMKLPHELVNDFTQVPSITLEEPLDPLALCAPNLEESDALDGIEKGEIISSGASVQPKDASLGKNPSDISFQTRQILAGKEDGRYSLDDNNEEICDNLKKLDAFSLASDKNNVLVGSPGSMIGKGDLEGPRGFSSRKESQNLSLGSSPVVSGSQWLPSLGQERALNMPADMARIPVDQLPLSSLTGWNNPQRDFENKWNTNVPKQLISNNEISWKSTDVDNLKRHIGSTMERADNSFLMQPPENLVLYYKDPQGEIQGPFTGSDIIGWFEVGYFGIDLQVRLANAPKEVPFAALGDVMPHLRAKAKPPPGFNTQKQIDVVDSLGRQAYGGIHSLPSGVKDADFALKNLKQQTISSSTEAENKFLESLMSGGVHGFSGPLASNFSTPGDAHLLAKQMAMEKQTPFSHPYSYLSGRDSIPAVSQPDVLSGPLLLHNKFLTSSESLLQHSPAASVGGILPRVQGDVDPFQMQHLPKSQFHNPSGLLSIRGDSPSVLTPEKIISSGLSQDPQILNLLQQQYLLQLQGQAPQGQHMSAIDKLLLLKQHQQKQEEQMHLLRQHHQHQLLSQAVSDQQMFSEGPFRQLPTSGLGIANQYLDPSRGLIPNELFPIESHLPQGKIQECVPQSISLNPNFSADTHPQFQYHHKAEGIGFGSSLEQEDKRYQNEALQANPYLVPSHDLPVPDVLNHSLANPPNSEVKELPSVLTKLDITGDSCSVISSNDNEESFNCAPKLTVDEPPSLYPANDAGYTGEKPSDKSAVDGCSNDGVEQLTIQGVKAKKVQEKKSKKNKSLKMNSSENTRPLPKVDVQELSPLRVEANKSHRVFEEATDHSNQPYFAVSSLDSHNVKKSFDVGLAKANLEAVKEESKSVEQSHKAWNPAPGFKAKSLVEIQLEEQMKTTEIAVTETSPPLVPIPSNPWTGIVSTSETKYPPLTESASVNTSITAAKKSQLHDLFAKEEAPKQHESDDDNKNFIDPKESKRGKKKGGKAKKSTLSVPIEVVEKSKSSMNNKYDKEVMSAIPSGPSLGDFVVWKGDQSANYAPLGWTNEAKKIPKPTSLRDIQKEQEKVARVPPSVQIPIQKQQPTPQAPRSSWPSASPTNASPSKPKLDDDLFWGPSNQTKDSKLRFDSPDLGSKTTPKNTPSRPKVANMKTTDDSSVKNKRESNSKYSEAMDFRNWCEKECVRLIGSKDTSFLEFCLTQTRSEAELFLKENLGSYDPDHQFIEKFLNYKDMLPAGVLEMAFQNRSQHEYAEVEDDSVRTVLPKKKGKKGKKVSPSVLGFSVVSNRIMMGEIQTVDD